MSVPTNLIPTKITGLPEYTGTSQAGYFPYVLDGTTYKVQFSNVASAGEVPPSRTLTAGTGLTGGGDLSANRVFAIANGGVGAQQLDTTGVVAGVYGNGSNVPTVTVDANGRVTSVTTSPVVATGYVPESRTITAGTGLIGGGSLANNITLSLNISSATPQALGNATAGVSTAAARGDHVHPAVNLSDTNETQGALPLGRGGTGDALSPVAGAVVYSTGTKFALTNPGAVGQVLVSTGTDEPVWSFVGSGTVTSVNASGGSTGMTFTGGPITTSGTLTLGGTLATSSGGTGLTGTPTNGQLLIGNGTGYALSTLTAGTAVSITNAAGSITIDNTAPDQIVSLTAGTAISVTGTYPNFTIGNTAPDQIVSLTGAGTTTISGTYPNFTITSNDQFTGTVTSVAASGGTTGLTFSGSPITSAGTLTLGGTLAVANGGTGATDAPTARLNLGAAASGANSDITSLSGITGGISTADFVAFDTTNATPPTTGQLAWNVDDGTLDVGLLNNVVLQVGQEQMFYAKNTSGGTIPLGTPVMFTGAIGASGKITFGLAVANGSVPPEYMMGVTAQNVANNGFGYVATFGLVRGFDTSGTPYGETWADGDLLYFSPSTPGGWTKVEPQAPNIHVPVAVVVNAASGGSGSIFVRMIQSERLGELQDVEINGGGPAAGQVLIYDASQSRWENNTLTAGSNVTITNGNGSITIAATEQFTGTVTSVAASGGTTGLTFSGSPITSAGTLTLGGTLAIGSGGTGATTAGGARTALSAAASGANTDITSVALTSGTILNAPTSGTDIVNKAYADSIASGINFHQSVRLATVAPLPANTYNNGSSGVGATLTGNANGALSIDGVAVVAGNRVLVKDEVAQANNGVYVVTQTGSGSTPYILTRATDFDSAGSGVDQIDAGDFFLVTAGSTLANTSWVQQTPLPITVGTTAIVFSQFGAPVLYSAGTGLSLAGTVFSITNTGVSASTYGSASQVPVLAVNAQGQITSASNTSISIAASQVTSGSLAVAQGGTGLGTTPTNGQLLIGNGTGYSLSTLSAGTGISVSNGSGSVTVTNTAPDQIVTITGGGATVVTGTYPNFTVSTTTGTGTVTSVDVSGGSTGLSFTGGPITSSGIITMGGTLGVANGGTGATTLSSGYLLKGNGTSAVSSSVVFDNGTNAGIGTTTPQAPLAIGSGSASASNPTYGGSLLIASQMSSLAQTGGIEFRSVNFASGYGHRVSSPDLGAGDTPLVFERRTNSVSWTESMRINSSGNVIASVDVRAPIFYDSNNTNFYLDPAGSSVLGIVSLFSSNDAQLYLNGNGTRWAGIQWTDDVGTDNMWFNGATSTFAIGGGGSQVANKKLHVNGGTTIGSGLASTAVSTNGLLVETRVDAPIFYDSNNTGFYVDPASGTNLNGPFVTTGGPAMTAGWNRTAMLGATFPVLVFNSANTKYSGIGVDYTTAAAGMYFWVNGSSSDLTGTGSLALGIDTGNFVTAFGSFRAPIFYDSDNTGYYVNPAGTSLFNTVGVDSLLNLSSGAPLFISSASAAYQRVDGRNEGSDSRAHWYGVTTSGATSNFRHAWYDGAAYFNVTASGGQIYFERSGGATVNASGDFRAPIFYDTNNTAFYLDPASTSRLNQAQFVNRISVGDGNGTPFLNTGSPGVWLSYNGDSNIFMGSETTTSAGFWLGGWRFFVNSSGAATATGDFRAPLYYDSQNTFYYVDPGSTSNMNVLQLHGSIPMINGVSPPNSAIRLTPNLHLNAGSGSAVILNWDNGTTSGLTFRIGNGAGSDVFYVFANGHTYAPIYYDINDTSFYVDPASGSRLGGQVTFNGGTNVASNGDVYARRDSGATGVYYFATGGQKYLFWDGSRYYFGSDGPVDTDVSFRAPIFYDINNTGFYVDPASTSLLNIVASYTGISAFDGGVVAGDPYGMIAVTRRTDANYSYFGLTRAGQLGMGMGIDTLNNFWVGGTTAGYNGTRSSVWFQSDTSGNVTATGSLRAPIFYDSQDTTYYLDPQTTSVLWEAATYYLRNIADVSTDHPYGLYFSSNRSSAYAIYRESGAWTHPYPDLRIAFHTGIKLGANASYQGIRFYTDYDMVTQVMSVNNGSDGVGAGHVFVNNVLQAGGDLRAPIFYDSNNTGYYLDPNSTGTSLNVAGAIVAAGNVTAYSDIRVKDNVEQISGALDRVQAIRGVTYTRNDLEDKERRYAGVIAQEIEQVLPEAVFDNGDRKAVDYNATIGLLIEAIKELRAEVAELKGK